MTAQAEVVPSATGPIFLAGASRSGKTLLRWLLSSHSRIVVSRRTEMWPRLYGRFGDLRRPHNLERCICAMLDHKQIAALAPDLDRLRRDFQRGAQTYPRLFALVHEQYAERCGKPRWGDQTGLIERFAPQVLSAYPGARVLHLIRDPRDRYEAIFERSGQRRGSVGECTARWLSSAVLARRNTSHYPDAYRVVRYEALVSRPEEALRAVCGFLGEEFEPAMLRMDGVRRYDGQRAAAGDGIPITTDYVGRYRQRLDKADLAFIQGIAGRQMLAFGYPSNAVALTAGERTRFATVAWPARLMRLMTWRVLDALEWSPGPLPRRLPGGTPV